jgi:hypothetical protein
LIRSLESVSEALGRFETLPGWLKAVSDSDAVRAALDRHVPEFASGELKLSACQVERVRLKPGSRTALYRLVYVERSTELEHVVDVVGEIGSPGADEPSSGTNGLPFGADGWRCYLPELRLNLGLSPPERPLPALTTLTDPQQARAFLEQSIRACSPAYEELRIRTAHPRVVRAKASRSTVLYDLESDGDPPAPSPVVAKTYRGDKGQNAYTGMQALWTSKLGTSETVSVAEPLAFVPELNVLVQGPVRGESTLKWLTRDAFAAGTSASLAELSAYVDKTGAGLAELHTCGVTHGSAVSWADRVADLEETVGRVATLAPELAGAAASLLTRIEEQAAALPPDRFVPTHGSFRPNQVLLNAGEIGFIDFDRFCQAEPGLDVGSFCAGLKDAGRLDGGDDDARRARLSTLDELRERFLQRYEATATISRERVALWEALDLFNAVLDCWTKMETGLDARIELLRHHLKSSGLAG